MEKIHPLCSLCFLYKAQCKTSSVGNAAIFFPSFPSVTLEHVAQEGRNSEKESSFLILMQGFRKSWSVVLHKSLHMHLIKELDFNVTFPFIIKIISFFILNSNLFNSSGFKKLIFKNKYFSIFFYFLYLIKKVLLLEHISIVMIYISVSSFVVQIIFFVGRSNRNTMKVFSSNSFVLYTYIPTDKLV